MVEQLAHTKLNPDCIEHAKLDQIMETKKKDTLQLTIQAQDQVQGAVVGLSFCKLIHFH
jgi:hypothetical protein